jgi:virginiamycin B lyase
MFGSRRIRKPTHEEDAMDSRSSIGTLTILVFTFVAIVVGTAPTLAAPANIAVFRVPTAEWFILDPVNGPRVVTWGCAGCGAHFPVPLDYDGDGKDDVAIASTAVPGTIGIVPLGPGGGSFLCTLCLAAPFDYNGDGFAEFGAYDAATGQWQFRKTRSASLEEFVRIPFGCAGCQDVPVPARFTAPGPQPLFSLFPTPAGGTPTGITTGPDGNVWFTELDGDRIGRITPAGVLTEFPLPAFGRGPRGITRGPDGNLWFTEFTGNRIGRITPAGIITEFLLPSADSFPDGITQGPDGNLWFTERNGNRIGRITPAGVIAEFPLPAGGGPTAITSGPDGRLWFTRPFASRIGAITTAGVIAEVALPAGSPADIVTGPDGNVWFTDLALPRIGRMAPNGATTFFDLTTLPGFHTATIAVGPDGNLFVKGFFQPVDPMVVGPRFDVIWRVALTGQVLGEFQPTGFLLTSQDGAITAGPDGRMWFTQTLSHRLMSMSVILPYAGIAVYRRTTGEWFIRNPDGTTRVVGWGCPGCGDVPVPRDYDGDGIDDIAVFRQSTGEWFILRSSDGGITHLAWGAPSGDVPVPRDYDDDGKADIAVYRTATGEWFILRSSDGGITHVQWGCGPCGDVPVPAKY